jgi:simple sugar transport system ATP-binding protein
MGVLLISADLDELIGMSDTLQVILRGRLVASMDPASVTPAELGAAMTGADAGTAGDRDSGAVSGDAPDGEEER